MSKMVTLRISKEEMAAVKSLLAKLHEVVNVNAEQDRKDREEAELFLSERRRLNEEIRRSAEKTAVEIRDLEVIVREMFPAFRGFAA